MKLGDFEKAIYQHSKSKNYAKGYVKDELYQAAFAARHGERNARPSRQGRRG